MNIAAERLEREILLENTIIKNQTLHDTATIGACKSDFTLMKALASKMDGVDDMSPIFYFPAKDAYARKLANAYILSEMRESYKLDKGYACVFDKRLLTEKYEHLHIYFRKNEILAVHRNDPERGRYFGVSIPRTPSSPSDEWEFKRNHKVESVSMDLKLGIYDVRFELFFNTIFDFYITSGIEW